MRVERLQDANGNRAAEGLRVLEDIARFLFGDPDLARRLKDLRHEVRGCLVSGLASRDTDGDVGTGISTASEGERANLAALISANACRVQEALRVLEESAKLAGDTQAERLEACRYAAYTCERDLQARLPAAHLWQHPLYVLVDLSLTDDPVAVAAAAAAGGAGIVQLRAKDLSVRAYRDIAERMQSAVRAAGALFIVNDHVDVAVAIGADGVHVGQDDLAIRDVRRVVGPLMLIGLSTHTPEQVHAAQEEGADYLGMGPMFATTTKPHEPERGAALLEAVRGQVRVPSYAIGGLNESRLRDLAPRLPHGAAVAGAVCRATDPAIAAARLRALLP